MLFSLFDGVKARVPMGKLGLEHVVELCRAGEWVKHGVVEEIVAGGRLKADLPCVTFGGLFDVRGVEGLVEASGLVAVDFDGVDDVERVVERAASLPFTALVHTTISGCGVRVVASADWVATEADYKSAWRSAERLYAVACGCVVDPAFSSIASVSFIAPDLNVILRQPSASLPRSHPPTPIRKKVFMPVTVGSDVCVGQIDYVELDRLLACVPADDYVIWRNMVWGLRAEGVPFHVADGWSAKSEKYDARVMSRLWAAEERGGIGFGTVVALGREHGYRGDVRYTGASVPVSGERVELPVAPVSGVVLPDLFAPRIDH